MTRSEYGAECAAFGGRACGRSFSTAEAEDFRLNAARAMRRCTVTRGTRDAGLGRMTRRPLAIVPVLFAVTIGAMFGVSCLATQQSQVDGRYARQRDCDGLRDACLGGGRCCSGMSCGFSEECCVNAGEACDHASDCCSGKCKDGTCTQSGPGEACSSESPCKQGLECSPALQFCYVLPGGYCRTSNDCGSNLCSDGTCSCGQGGALCQSGSDCCDGYVCGPYGLCAGNGGAACDSDVDCNDGCCLDGECGSCGEPIGDGCSSDADCGPDATCDPVTGTCL